jgi:hypothetical protein
MHGHLKVIPIQDKDNTTGGGRSTTSFGLDLVHLPIATSQNTRGAVGLRKNRLQKYLDGPYFAAFSVNSSLLTEKAAKSVLVQLFFRFDPLIPAAS